MTTPPEAPPVPPARGNRVWRMVAIVVAVQLVVIALGLAFFTMVGLANAGPGGCGGG